MKIEHTIRRAGGTKVPMGTANYHFAPTSEATDAPHVADVTDEGHIQRFLSIDGFRIAPGSTKGAAPSPAPAPAPVAAPAPSAAAADPLVLKNGDTTVDLRELSGKKLLAFAEENGIELTAKQKRLGVDDLRAAIAAAATGA